MEKINQAIDKYERGLLLHKRILAHKTTSSIEKNRASYQINLLKIVIKDLESIKKEYEKL